MQIMIATFYIGIGSQNVVNITVVNLKDLREDFKNSHFPHLGHFLYQMLHF